MNNFLLKKILTSLISYQINEDGDRNNVQQYLLDGVDDFYVKMIKLSPAPHSREKCILYGVPKHC